uniref:Uncharacterized protein n=1 Tax=Plectus sambesii TaxID=2011161 RepID=A0A914VMC5_9BILA
MERAIAVFGHGDLLAQVVALLAAGVVVTTNIFPLLQDVFDPGGAVAGLDARLATQLRSQV